MNSINMDDIEENPLDIDIVEEVRERSRIKSTSATQTALNKLSKALASYVEVDNEARRRLTEEMKSLQNIRFYNMDVLAASLVLLIKMDNIMNPNTFRETVDSVFYKFPNVNTDELRQILRENLLRYIYSIVTNRYVNSF